ncbi:MAG: LytTR family DNA-binding domain-containing protein [Bacteroidales bacterium]
MKCIAIDDEPLALNIINEYCEKTSFLKLLAVFTNPFDALKTINESKVDIIFLDIHMPNISGIDFYKSLMNPPMVIFTTAFSEHALYGFEVNAVDYLLKPFTFERFVKAINRAYELISLKKEAMNQVQVQPDFLMIRADYNTVRIDVNELLYVEGLKDYIKVFCKNKKLITKSTLKNIEEKLPVDKFCRIHKSFIIALDKIERIENNRVIIGENYLPIGDQYKPVFYEKIKTRMI